MGQGGRGWVLRVGCGSCGMWMQTAIFRFNGGFRVFWFVCVSVSSSVCCGVCFKVLVSYSLCVLCVVCVGANIYCHSQGFNCSFFVFRCCVSSSVPWRLLGAGCVKGVCLGVLLVCVVAGCGGRVY